MLDGTSRLARYLPDVLKMNDSLQYHSVFIYAVAQWLDCREKTSRPLLTLHGIRQDRLDAQLVAGLTERTSKPKVIEYTLKRFHEQLQKRLLELQEQTLKAADSIATLQDQRRNLKGQAKNLGVAVAKMGHSTTLLQELAAVE